MYKLADDRTIRVFAPGNRDTNDVKQAPACLMPGSHGSVRGGKPGHPGSNLRTQRHVDDRSMLTPERLRQMEY